MKRVLLSFLLLLAFTLSFSQAPIPPPPLLTEKLSTKGHPKAIGINMCLEYPYGWIKIDNPEFLNSNSLYELMNSNNTIHSKINIIDMLEVLPYKEKQRILSLGEKGEKEVLKFLLLGGQLPSPSSCEKHFEKLKQQNAKLIKCEDLSKNYNNFKVFSSSAFYDDEETDIEYQKIYYVIKDYKLILILFNFLDTNDNFINLKGLDKRIEMDMYVNRIFNTLKIID